MYYRLQMADANADYGAAFKDREVAEEIRDIFNERYASNYEVVEDDDPSDVDKAQAGVIRGLENV